VRTARVLARATTYAESEQADCLYCAANTILATEAQGKKAIRASPIVRMTPKSFTLSKRPLNWPIAWSYEETMRPWVSSNGCPSARAHITTACPTHDLGASVVSAMLLLYLALGPTSRQEITLATPELFRVYLVSHDGLRVL
jgi:hypothetical protein